MRKSCVTETELNSQKALSTTEISKYKASNKKFIHAKKYPQADHL